MQNGLFGVLAASFVSVIGLQAGATTILSEDFESGSLDPAIWSLASTVSDAIRVESISTALSGSSALYVDQGSGTGAVQNRADLSFDLSGRTSAVLSFDMVHFFDEQTAPDFAAGTGDGVGVSFDGTTFISLQQGNAAPDGRSMLGTQTYSYSFDLKAIADANSAAFGPNTVLRFLQVDDSDIGSDGRGYDNILIAEATDETLPPIPLPASLPLLLGGIGMLGWMRRHRRS